MRSGKPRLRGSVRREDATKEQGRKRAVGDVTCFFEIELAGRFHTVMRSLRGASQIDAGAYRPNFASFWKNSTGSGWCYSYRIRYPRTLSHSVVLRARAYRPKEIMSFPGVLVLPSRSIATDSGGRHSTKLFTWPPEPSGGGIRPPARNFLSKILPTLEIYLVTLERERRYRMNQSERYTYRCRKNSSFRRRAFAAEKCPSRNRSAQFNWVRNENGRPKLGLLTQLGPGITVERCGEGFNGETLMVRANGQHYFVFLQDLELQTAAAQ
jgi:hypothetical protein